MKTGDGTNNGLWRENHHETSFPTSAVKSGTHHYFLAPLASILFRFPQNLFFFCVLQVTSSLLLIV